MRDLSLHVLDLIQNSLEAGASWVHLEILLDSQADTLTIRISDNGRGMDEAMVKQVRDPFVTTRTTRRVGLGLPLVDMSASHCNGYLDIFSTPGQGTVITAVYQESHLDRPPLGDLTATIQTLVVTNPELDFQFDYRKNQRHFHLSTRELQQALDGVSFSQPEVLQWLNEYLRENLQEKEK